MRDLPKEKQEAGYPCTLCGVRPDVACRHRPADTSYSPPEQPDDVDKYKPKKGDNAGLNFGTRHRYISGGGTYRGRKVRK